MNKGRKLEENFTPATTAKPQLDKNKPTKSISKTENKQKQKWRHGNANQFPTTHKKWKSFPLSVGGGGVGVVVGGVMERC